MLRLGTAAGRIVCTSEVVPEALQSRLKVTVDKQACIDLTLAPFPSPVPHSHKLGLPGNFINTAFLLIFSVLNTKRAKCRELHR